jgi:hypothetical protein
MTRKQDDNIDMLLKYLRGELSGEEAKRLQSRLKRDRELNELYQLLKQLSRMQKTLKWPQLKSAVEKLSGRLFDDFRKSKRKHGIMTFDSRLLPVPEGIRPATVDTRRVKCQFDDLSLDMSMYPVTPDSYEVIGQVINIPDDATFMVSLKNRELAFSVTTDRFGMFHFERVPAMEYELSLWRKRKKIGAVTIAL